MNHLTLLTEDSSSSSTGSGTRGDLLLDREEPRPDPGELPFGGIGEDDKPAITTGVRVTNLRRRVLTGSRPNRLINFILAYPNI